MHQFHTHQAATLRHQHDLAAAAHRMPRGARTRSVAGSAGARWTRRFVRGERRPAACVAVA